MCGLLTVINEGVLCHLLSSLHQRSFVSLIVGFAAGQSAVPSVDLDAQSIIAVSFCPFSKHISYLLDTQVMMEGSVSYVPFGVCYKS